MWPTKPSEVQLATEVRRPSRRLDYELLEVSGRNDRGPKGQCRLKTQFGIQRARATLDTPLLCIRLSRDRQIRSRPILQPGAADVVYLGSTDAGHRLDVKSYKIPSLRLGRAASVPRPQSK